MKTKVLISTVILLFSIHQIVNAQVTFQKAYGGNNWDYAKAVQQTTDDGYIIAGYTQSFGNNSFDTYLVKTNALGVILWSKTYGGSGTNHAFSVQQTTDGGYIVAGNTDETGTGGYDDLFLLKTDANGDTLWTKSYGTSVGYELMDFKGTVRQTTDGGYIMVGHRRDSWSTEWDIYLVKTDMIGNIIWTRTYGGANNDYGTDVEQTTDGGYIITGITESFGVGLTDVYLIKTDSNGDISWTKTYGGSGGYSKGNSIIQTSGGNYLVAGYTDSYGQGSGDIYLLKIDTNGTLLWSKTYGGADIEYGYSVQPTNDGNYIITGRTESFGGGLSDFYLLKITPNGDTLWTKTYGSADYEYARAGYQTSDNGYVIIGRTESFGLGGRALYLVKTDSNGYSGGCNEYNTNTIITNPATVTTNANTIVNSTGSVYYPTIVVNSVATIDSTTCFMLACNVTASFTPSAITVCQGETINFTNTSTGAISYQWLENNTGFSTDTNTTRTFNTAGTYTISLIAGNNICTDSAGIVITVNAADTSVTQSGNTLTSNATGATYQWIDCNSNQAINGETNQSFTATSNGNYAVQVTQNGCTDTSACYPITSVGIGENTLGSGISIYPNPTNGNVTIDMGGNLKEEVLIRITNINGQEVLIMDNINKQLTTINMADLPEGMYFIHVQSKSNTAVFKQMLMK